MVMCKLGVFRDVGGFREGFEGSQDWDLFLRITEKLKVEEIGHVPHVLYHWRSTKNSTATSLSTKKYVIPRSLLSVNDALKRRKADATARLDDEKNGYLRVNFHIPVNQPLVSILIPTKDHFELITRCIESILSNTCYSNYEIVILDNDTTCEHTLEYFSKIESIKNISIKKISCPFNYSYINNQGVKFCAGEILAFVNNDIEAIDSEWLGEMVSHAIRPDIGCVGSKLLYPDGHIQHAGVVLGIGGIAGHGQKHFPSWNDGYKHRLKVVQNYEAVTAACMLLKKKIFQKVGGFDEENLKVAYNDVDLCIKVREAGYLNLWTPYALLKHHESASRGFDKDPNGKARFDKEKEYMKKRWAHKFLADPAYNPNLSLKHEDFSLNYRPYKNLE
jgi:GT2 family glycosyltransferase